MKVLIDGVTGEATPPHHYGGIERVNATLVKGLQELGVEFKLLCREGSTIDCDKMCFPFRHDPVQMIREAEQRWGEFDVYHDSSCGGLMHKALKYEKPTFWTVHGVGGDGELCAYLSRGSMNASPKSSKGDLPFTLLGLNLDDYPPCYEKEDYIIFIGQAIEDRKLLHYFSAIGAKYNLRSVAIIPHALINVSYYDKCFNESRFAYINGANDTEKLRWLSKAKAMVHCSAITSDWQDASPVAVLESLAVGTPVIGNFSGGIPEMIEDGRTGFLVSSVEEAIEAYGRIESINPIDCREYMEDKRNHVVFANRMLTLYEALSRKDYKTRIEDIVKVQSSIDEVEN